MKHFSNIIITLALCALIWPLQSCANGPKSAVAEPVEDTLAEPVDDAVAEPVEASDAKKPNYRIFVEALLKDARQQDASKTCFPLFFARKFLDIPYVANTLEINDTEALVINVDELDCTTLVETVTALTLCAYQQQFTFAAFQNNLRNIQWGILGFCGLFLFISLILIGNSLRLNIYAKRFNIKSLLLIGATRSFVRKPFLAKGFAQGLIGGAIATAFVALFIYGGIIFIPDFFDTSKNILIAILLGGVFCFSILFTTISALIFTNRYIKINPDSLYL